jgi:hypothetical protein
VSSTRAGVRASIGRLHRAQDTGSAADRCSVDRATQDAMRMSARSQRRSAAPRALSSPEYGETVMWRVQRAFEAHRRSRC